MPVSASTSAIVLKWEAYVLQLVADWNAALIVSSATTAIQVLFVLLKLFTFANTVGVVLDVKSIRIKELQPANALVPLKRVSCRSSAMQPSRRLCHDCNCLF